MGGDSLSFRPPPLLRDLRSVGTPKTHATFIGGRGSLPPAPIPSADNVKKGLSEKDSSFSPQKAVERMDVLFTRLDKVSSALNIPKARTTRALDAIKSFISNTVEQIRERPGRFLVGLAVAIVFIGLSIGSGGLFPAASAAALAVAKFCFAALGITSLALTKWAIMPKNVVQTTPDQGLIKSDFQKTLSLMTILKQNLDPHHLKSKIEIDLQRWDNHALREIDIPEKRKQLASLARSLDKLISDEMEKNKTQDGISEAEKDKNHETLRALQKAVEHSMNEIRDINKASDIVDESSVLNGVLDGFLEFQIALAERYMELTEGSDREKIETYRDQLLEIHPPPPPKLEDNVLENPPPPQPRPKVNVSREENISKQIQADQNAALDFFSNTEFESFPDEVVNIPSEVATPSLEPVSDDTLNNPSAEEVAQTQQEMDVQLSLKAKKKTKIKTKKTESLLEGYSKADIANLKIGDEVYVRTPKGLKKGVTVEGLFARGDDGKGDSVGDPIFVKMENNVVWSLRQSDKDFPKQLFVKNP